MKHSYRSTFLTILIAFFASALPLLAETDEVEQAAPNGGGAAGVIGGLVGLVIGVVFVVAMWKVYTKAGKPGWASLIPFYNQYVLLQIVGRPGWWLILLFIPFVNFIIALIVLVDLAKSFGKGVGYAIGLILLAPIFFLMLAFGDAQYTGPAAGRLNA
jgi:hypothetical protein